MRRRAEKAFQPPLNIVPNDDAAERLTALPCDKWVASSAMQKAIRRGDTETAQRATLTVHEANPSSVWRRLLVIAFEDVGVASPATLVNVTRLACAPQKRKQLGGERAAIVQACRLLAEAPKDRSADYLIAASMHDPGLEDVRDECGGNPVERRLEIAVDTTRPLCERAVAAWYASGVESWPERRVGRGDFEGLMRAFVRIGVPHDLLDAVRIAVRKTREPIVIFLPLLWLTTTDQNVEFESGEISATKFVNEVPLYALDGHTRVGRRAIERFYCENSEIATFLVEHVSDFRAQKALRLAAFYADSALIRPRLKWRYSRELETLGISADFRSVRIEPFIGHDLIELVRRNISQLNEIRAELFAAEGRT